MPDPESVSVSPSSAVSPPPEPSPPPKAKWEILKSRGLRFTTKDFSIGRNVTDQPINTSEFITKLQAAFDHRGLADSARRTYENTAFGFLEWAKAKGLTLGTMPESAPMEYLAESLPERATAAHVFGQQGLKTLFSILADHGIKVAPYLWYTINLSPEEKAIKTAKHREYIKRRNAASAAAAAAAARISVKERAQPMSAVNGSGGEVTDNIFDDAQAAPVPQQAQAVVLPPRAVEAPAPMQAPAPGKAPVRRAQAQPGIFPQSGQVKIHKRATEPGLPPGQLILIGQYTIEDLSGEGSIAQFIHTHLVPQYGPYAGGRNTVYIVERLDDRGQIMPGQRWEIPVLAPSGPERGSAQQERSPSVQPSFPQSSEIETKLVDYLQKSESESRNAFMGLLTDMRDSTKTGGLDATTLMLLLEKHRPEPMNWKEIMSEIRKEREQNTPAPIILPEPAPVKESNQGMEVVVGLLGKMIDRLGQISSQPPPPPPPARDPIFEMMMKTVIDKAFTPTPSPLDSKLDRLLEMAVSPQKTKISEMAENLKEIIDLTKSIKPDEPGPHPIIEGLGMLLENADKVGEMFARISALRAPMVGSGPGGPGGGQSQPQPEQKKLIEVPPLPSEAILALRSTAQAQTTDQHIVDALFKLMQTLAQSPAEGHKRLCQAIYKGFLEVGSKSEIRALATNIFVKCGERNIATDDVIEKVTACLHKHYTEIYRSLTNQEKVLPDAPVKEEKQKVEEKATTKVEEKKPELSVVPAPAPEKIKVEDLTK